MPESLNLKSLRYLRWRRVITGGFRDTQFFARRQCFNISLVYTLFDAGGVTSTTLFFNFFEEGFYIAANPVDMHARQTIFEGKGLLS